MNTNLFFGESMIIRLDENDNNRQLRSKQSTGNAGNFCNTCKKFFKYLTKDKCTCISCESRSKSFKK